MTNDWIPTSLVASRLGYLTDWYLVSKLEALQIPCLRLTPRSRRLWHWPTIEAQIVPRGTVAKDDQTEPNEPDAA